MGEQRPTVTQENDGDVGQFVAAVADEVRRADARTLLDLMTLVTGRPARMWGTAIVGFGRYHYVYATGRDGDAPAVGFSRRKAATTVYLVDGSDGYAESLARLGPHTTGRSCLYLKRLDVVDLGVLAEMVACSYRLTTTRTWPPTT